MADNFNVSDFFDVTVASNGAFTESSALTALQFLNGGNPVALNGLQSTYSFYVTFSSTGMQAPVPALGSGLSSPGVFTTGNYTFWANPNSQPVVTPVPGGAPVISGNAGAIPLFSGTLVSGTSTLTAPAGGGYSPTANLDLTLTACAAAGQPLATGGTCTGNETAFFVDPPPADFNLAVSNFSATPSVTTLAAGSSTFLDVDGGGGNVTFASDIPEPASLVVLGSGLIGLGMMRRRRINA